jgi:hypothetical protein
MLEGAGLQAWAFLLSYFSEYIEFESACRGWSSCFFQGSLFESRKAKEVFLAGFLFLLVPLCPPADLLSNIS